MSEKKYPFKIDRSKAIEKFGISLETHDRVKTTDSDFKIACVNCLYYKESKLI
ncbi:MAG: hypothetical protein ACR5K2_04775 [Wolbachia sp.]